MRHIPDGVLRRLDDEPLAVPDRVIEHAARCGRCAARRALIAADTEFAARLLSGPQLVPDTDAAWERLERELHRRTRLGPERPRGGLPAVPRARRFPKVSLRAGLVLGAIGVVIAGTAAAATLTTIFAPTHVAPMSLSRSDVRAITAFMGLGDGNVLGGFPSPSGSSAARFGTIKWSSSGLAYPVSSFAEATAQARLRVSLPAHLPAGVGAAEQFIVQPRVSATVSFTSAAGDLSASTVALDAGPAVLVEYGASRATGLPTLGVASMPRPTARSTGASMSQIEAFLLRQPGVPAELADEIRALGDLRTTLPVPVPQGASARSVRVAGWPGVLLADSSNAATGVVWEDGRGMLHVVAGLLDSHDLLNVAAQLR